MTITLAKLSKFLKNFSLFEAKPKIVVGVSGGPDSIALSFILNQWIKLQKGELIALIIDHKIRSESYKEALKVKKILNKLSIKNVVIRIRNKNVSKKMSLARFNRFEAMIKYCKKNNILHLFLGHHYDDNLETFLIRSVSGSNLEGLNSISYISNLNKINLIRPLLNNTKKQIVAFNKEKEIEYIIDPSNEHLKYTRVIIRNFLNKTKQIKLI